MSHEIVPFTDVDRLNVAARVETLKECMTATDGYIDADRVRNMIDEASVFLADLMRSKGITALRYGNIILHLDFSGTQLGYVAISRIVTVLSVQQTDIPTTGKTTFPVLGCMFRRP
jgi:hypothetical protein